MAKTKGMGKGRKSRFGKERAKYSPGQWYYIKKWGKEKGFLWALWEDWGEDEKRTYIWENLRGDERMRVQHHNRNKPHTQWAYASKPPPVRQKNKMGGPVPASSKQNIRNYFVTIDDISEEGNYKSIPILIPY